MGNRLLNAGFLDGTSGWSPLGAMTLAVDEAVLGAPGRAALVATGGAAAGGANGVASDPVIVTAAGQVFEAYADWSAALGGVQVVLDWMSGGGQVTSSAFLPIVRPAIRSLRRGLTEGLNRSYIRAAAPAGAAKARLSVWTPSAGALQLAVAKPYLAPAPSDPRPTLWDPGSHNNPDLQLPAWPSQLPPFQADAAPQPIANAKAWAGDAGIPVREDLYRALHYEYRPHMRLDMWTQDILDQFFAATRDSFWVVRPDTNQLCTADWLADGAPKTTSIAGPHSIVEVGLHLEIA